MWNVEKRRGSHTAELSVYKEIIGVVSWAHTRTDTRKRQEHTMLKDSGLIVVKKGLLQHFVGFFFLKLNPSFLVLRIVETID